MVDRAGLMLPESRAAAMELGPQDAFGVALRDPSRASGLGGLGTTMADVQVAFEQVVNQPAPDYTTMRAPQAPAGPAVYFDQARNLFSVNGYAFDAEDYNSAVQSRALLDAEPAQPPAGGTWTRIGTGMFEQYLASIEDPTLGTRFGRSFDIGVQNLKTLGGAGLQFLGAEETGAGVVNRASEELQRLSPFQVSAAEVASGELGAIEYAVSVLGQQGPNILESIGTALVGAAAGGVASGNPIGAAVGSFGALLSKSALKGAAREAAEAYARGAASTAQKKLLARIGGAAAATAVTTTPWASRTYTVRPAGKARGQKTWTLARYPLPLVSPTLCCPRSRKLSLRAGCSAFQMLPVVCSAAQALAPESAQGWKV